MTDELPAVPEGWSVTNTRWATWLARKWFGDHYKEVAVGHENGPEALHGAATSVDQEAELRAKAVVDATNAQADALEAQAASLRTQDSGESQPEATG